MKAALWYAQERGWPVFPLKPGRKEPAVPGGFHAATTDETQIRTWWTQQPRANIGIPTGAVSGIVLIDVDVAETPKDLPPTECVVRTGDGWHYFYAHPGVTTPNGARVRTNPPIDIRGDGGYLVAPPSVHESGVQYKFQVDPFGRGAKTPGALGTCPEWAYKREKPKAAPAWLPLVSHWVEGQRHKLALAFVGWTTTLGWDYAEISEFLSGVQLAAQDDEDRSADLKSTMERHHRGDPIVAERALAEAIGPEAMDALRRGLGKRAHPKGAGTQVLIGPGKASEALTATLRSLLSRDDLYVFGGKISQAGDEPLILENGAIFPEVDKTVRLVKRDAKGQYVPMMPPDWLVKAIQATRREDLLEAGGRELLRCANHPIIASDGTATKSGYCPLSGWYARTGEEFQSVSVPESIEAARDILLEPFLDFDFASETDRAAAVAAILTVVGRSAITGCTPGIAVNGTVAGSGKTLIIEVLSMLATGGPAKVDTAPRNEEESRKKITTLLMEAPAIVLFDNADIDVGGQSFDALLTSRMWSDRKLGGNTMVHVPNNTVWTLTGNGLQLTGDAHRRWMWIHLHSKHEKPEERPADSFHHPDLLGWVRQERANLVYAALWVLQRVLRGEAPRGQAVGSFEEWGQIIRGAVLSLGLPDPWCPPVGRASGDHSTWVAVLAKWQETIKEPLTTSELRAKLEEDLSVTALADLIIEAGGPEPRRGVQVLGRFLKSRVNRLGHGVALRNKRTNRGSVWSVG